MVSSRDRAQKSHRLGKGFEAQLYEPMIDKNRLYSKTCGRKKCLEIDKLDPTLEEKSGIGATDPTPKKNYEREKGMT